MNDTNGRYKRAAGRKKRAPVKHVKVSPEMAKAYEKAAKERDDREREYTRHLGQDNKPR